MPKIKNKKRYVRKQKADTSKDDELDLLGDKDVESFTGSQEDLEGAADNLFASPPCPQPLRFESLSLKTPAKTVPPTPGTALQQKVKSKLKRSLGSQFNIQLQQQMRVFQASMLKAMKSLRDEFQSFKKTFKEVEVDQTSTSASKPGTSKHTENLDPTPPLRTQPSSHTDEAMEVEITSCMILTRDMSSVFSTRPKKHADKRKHKVRSRYLSQSSSSEEDQSSVHIQRSSKPSRALLIKTNLMIFWPLIYLRVNILNPLPPLQSGTKWDILVMRTKSRS